MLPFTVMSQELIWDSEQAFTTQNIQSKQTSGIDTIVVASSILVRGKVDVPKMITLKFTQNGRLKIENEKSSITVNGTIEASKNQIFDHSNSGVLTYDGSSVSNVKLLGTKIFYPEWWGFIPNVVPSNTTNPEKSNTRHFTVGKEMMLDVAASGGGEIHFSEGVYYIRDLIIDFDNVIVSGEGRKTILRTDRKNFETSTRRGALFSIQGPTTEKLYHKLFPEGKYQTGNFTFDNVQKTIENITIRDLTIEWNDISALEDPAMNGLTIINARNVLIDNVHVDLKGANRAFYIGAYFDGDVTENITIQNSSCVASRTGVFILHGFDQLDVIRRKLVLDNIEIQNNDFDVVGLETMEFVNNEQLNVEWLDRYGSGVFLGGSEFTSTFEVKGTTIFRKLGRILIDGNRIKNADFGVRADFGNKHENKGYDHEVIIRNNHFIDFTHVGVLAPFTTTFIIDNIFDVEQLLPVRKDVFEAEKKGYFATAIHIAKAPWEFFKSRHGPDNVVIQGNTFNGCYQQYVPVVMQPNNDAILDVRNNTFNYDTSCSVPTNDIVIATSRRKFRTKRATVRLSNNLRDSSNQSSTDASVQLDVRREKHITLIDNER
ncbi:MAG: hypothetical protein CMC13_03300 [Flavobacteriaceae bacterium]|nr:hypothetical protein [Flavobacteriaceae bacterium]